MALAARSALTLRYREPALEREFLTFHAGLIALHQRVAALIGIAIFSAAPLWIDWLVPNLHEHARWLFFGAAVPALALTFLLSFVRLSDLMRQVVSCFDFCVTTGVLLGLLRTAPGYTEGAVAATAPEIFQVAGLPALFLIIIVTVTYVRLRFTWALLFGPLLVVVYRWVAADVETSADVQAANTIAILSTTLLGASLAYLIEAYTRRSWWQQREVERERRRSDALLHNILPSAVVERVRAGEESIADRYAEATVMFADLVGFTPFADGREPEEVVRLLAAVVVDLDRIAHRHGLEKIKTIGDAFMAVAGAPVACADHADRVLAAAGEILAAVPEVSTRLGYPLDLRIGVATGPLVGGIIGERKLAYDVWGDTVNTASRMESQGIVGAVQLTDATRAALLGDYRLEPRQVDVKGKGRIRTWLWRPAAESVAERGVRPDGRVDARLLVDIGQQHEAELSKASPQDQLEGDHRGGQSDETPNHARDDANRVDAHSRHPERQPEQGTSAGTNDRAR